jgi:hypothetical protein
VSGHTKWRDIKRRRPVDSGPMHKAPSLLVEVEKDGDHWMFRIAEWGLFGQAESLDEVEDSARDLVGIAVGIAIVVDAYDAAEEAERAGLE